MNALDVILHATADTDYALMQLVAADQYDQLDVCADIVKIPRND